MEYIVVLGLIIIVILHKQDGMSLFKYIYRHYPISQGCKAKVWGLLCSAA